MDQAQLDETQTLLRHRKRQVAERLLAGGELTANEIQAINQLEVKLGIQERVLRIKEATRHAAGTQT